MMLMHFRTRAAGASLVEFALVLPLLTLLIIGGMSLFVRNLYRDSLDEAAEQAAWSAARSGGDLAAVHAAVQQAIPFVPLNDVFVSATSTGYHAEVTVIVGYRGTAITSLPFFNTPLTDAQATATNQQERAFALVLDGNDAPGVSPADAHQSALQPIAMPKDLPGPAAWPAGPAAIPGGR
jgi:Flp pilus assembly protein TadG